MQKSTRTVTVVFHLDSFLVGLFLGYSLGLILSSVFS